MPAPHDRRARVASIAVRISGVWILLGAVAKLALGTPADLPAPVRDSFLGPDRAFWVAIAAELAVSLTALAHPRLAWAFLAGVLLVFVAVLVKLIATGAASCGCFGPTIAFPPALMLAIDAACLVKLAWARPWSAIPASGWRLPLVLPALVVSLAAPWAVLGPPPLSRTSPPPPPSAGPWALPDHPPRWVTLEPKRWIGSPIRETELHRWTDTSLLPQDAVWILYRINCPHCARHLRDLAAAPVGEAFYVLVRLPEEGDEKERVVTEKPQNSLEVELPAVTQYAIQTPWELRVEGGVVKEAVQRLYD